jgi:hypothetical protein
MEDDSLEFDAHKHAYSDFEIVYSKPLKIKNPIKSWGYFLFLAEAQGFEPWKPFGLPVFKTGAIDHSAKLPV